MRREHGSQAPGICVFLMRRTATREAGWMRCGEYLGRGPPGGRQHLPPLPWTAPSRLPKLAWAGTEMYPARGPGIVATPEGRRSGRWQAFRLSFSPASGTNAGVSPSNLLTHRWTSLGPQGSRVSHRVARPRPRRWSRSSRGPSSCRRPRPRPPRRGRRTWPPWARR